MCRVAGEGVPKLLNLETRGRELCGVGEDTREGQKSLEGTAPRQPFYVFAQNYILSAGISGGGRAK